MAQCEKSASMKRGNRTGKAKGTFPRFYGRHAVIAALANPDRVVRKIWGTREALNALDLPPVLPIVYADGADLGRMVPSDAPHQGIVAEVEPLDDVWLGDALEEAGCTDTDILAHCRQAGEHVRGCWLVDQILKKESPGGRGQVDVL